MILKNILTRGVWGTGLWHTTFPRLTISTCVNFEQESSLKSSPKGSQDRCIRREASPEVYLPQPIPTPDLPQHLQRSLLRRYPRNALPPTVHLQYRWPAASPVPSIYDLYGHLLGWLQQPSFSENEKKKVVHPASFRYNDLFRFRDLCFDAGANRVLVSFPWRGLVGCYTLGGEIDFAFDIVDSPNYPFRPGALLVTDRYCPGQTHWLVANPLRMDIIVFNRRGRAVDILGTQYQAKVLARAYFYYAFGPLSHLLKLLGWVGHSLAPQTIPHPDPRRNTKLPNIPIQLQPPDQATREKPDKNGRVVCHTLCQDEHTYSVCNKE